MMMMAEGRRCGRVIHIPVQYTGTTNCTVRVTIIISHVRRIGLVIYYALCCHKRRSREMHQTRHTSASEEKDGQTEKQDGRWRRKKTRGETLKTKNDDDRPLYCSVEVISIRLSR